MIFDVQIKKTVVYASSIVIRLGSLKRWVWTSVLSIRLLWHFSWNNFTKMEHNSTLIINLDLCIMDNYANLTSLLCLNLGLHTVLKPTQIRNGWLNVVERVALQKGARHRWQCSAFSLATVVEDRSIFPKSSLFQVEATLNFSSVFLNLHLRLRQLTWLSKYLVLVQPMLFFQSSVSNPLRTSASNFRHSGVSVCATRSIVNTPSNGLMSYNKQKERRKVLRNTSASNYCQPHFQPNWEFIPRR